VPLIGKAVGSHPSPQKDAVTLRRHPLLDHAPPTPDEFATVVKYLAKNFGKADAK